MLRATGGRGGLGVLVAASLALGVTACGHTRYVGGPTEATITVTAPNPTPSSPGLPSLGRLNAAEYRLLATDLENGYAADFTVTGPLSARRYRIIAGAGRPFELPPGFNSAYRIRYVARVGLPVLHRVDSVVAVFRSIRSATIAQTRIRSSLEHNLRRYHLKPIHVPGPNMEQRAGYSYTLRLGPHQRLLVTIIIYRVHNVACEMIIHSVGTRDIERMIIGAQRHALRIFLSG